MDAGGVVSAGGRLRAGSCDVLRRASIDAHLAGNRAQIEANQMGDTFAGDLARVQSELCQLRAVVLWRLANAVGPEK